MGFFKDWFSAEFTKFTKKYAKHLSISTTNLHFIIASFQVAYFSLFLGVK